MWLYLIGGFLLLVGIIGGILTGGIFTIVLVPLGAVVLVSALLYAMWARATAARSGGQVHATQTPDRPLPQRSPSSATHAPSTPEKLADARRTQQ